MKIRPRLTGCFRENLRLKHRSSWQLFTKGTRGKKYLLKRYLPILPDRVLETLYSVFESDRTGTFSFNNTILIQMNLVTRKPVFGVWDQVRFKPASWRLEILNIETRGIILSRQWTTKGLIRRRGCAGWSAPLLFAYGKKQVFSWRG